jgi:hypothetical protein
VLQEMAAVGWSNEEVAAAVRRDLDGWFRLLTEVAERFAAEHGSLGPFRPAEISAQDGLAFLGAESLILLGVGESHIPCRAALRRDGTLIRTLETGGAAE